jgi:hypothetical protein
MFVVIALTQGLKVISNQGGGGIREVGTAQVNFEPHPVNCHRKHKGDERSRAVVAFTKADWGPVLHQSLKLIQLRSEVPQKRRFAVPAWPPTVLHHTLMQTDGQTHGTRCISLKLVKANGCEAPHANGIRAHVPWLLKQRLSFNPIGVNN